MNIDAQNPSQALHIATMRKVDAQIRQIAATMLRHPQSDMDVRLAKSAKIIEKLSEAMGNTTSGEESRRFAKGLRNLCQ